MRTHIFAGTAGAAVLAAVATVQPEARPRTASPQEAGARPAYQQQLVTVEGCLYRERARSAEAALEIAGDPESALVFVLEKAEVLSRTDTKPGTADTAQEGRILGPAEIENERVGVPSGDPDATGTTGTTGTADARARGRTGEGAAIAGARTPYADRYAIVGLEDERLKLFAGRRVALSGQFEPAAVHESPDAAPAPEGAPAALPQFRAAAVKPVAGICPPKP